MQYPEQRKLGLKLFRGEKYKELRHVIREEKCFDELSPIAEKAGAIEYWDQFPDEWMYFAGCYWSIPNEMLKGAFLKMTEELWIYNAGLYWSIPNEMLGEAFLKFKKDIFIYHAGCYWSGISDEMRKKAFRKFEFEAWKHKAGCDWFGVKEE